MQCIPPIPGEKIFMLVKNLITIVHDRRNKRKLKRIANEVFLFFKRTCIELTLIR